VGFPRVSVSTRSSRPPESRDEALTQKALRYTVGRIDVGPFGWQVPGDQPDMNKAAITVLRSREDVDRLWQSPEYRPRYIHETDATVSFADAPGDRGTEIHVELPAGRAGKVGELAARLTGSESLAKVKDDLRRFKQHVETGVIPRSDAVPEGELAERKLKQRPAQPLEQAELEKVGV
jgi:hypothetical protein